MPHIAPPDNLAPDHRLLELTRRFVAETHPGRPAATPRLNDNLERDLGLDSLARVELFNRIETEFGRRLPESALGEAETLAALLAALGAAAPAAPPPKPAAHLASAAVAPPEAAADLVAALEWHAAAHPGRQHILYYETSEITHGLSYGELLTQARRVAAGLAGKGCARARRWRSCCRPRWSFSPLFTAP